ncbi:MAG: aminotransferase class IV [Anaeromicrobium sp.]|jgi:branched-chain amino acid aminotransferase|uniref:aminotransferase class IV n=1 Tax=Anaeromicrobium sp. TaxID=1929132 RepID=UPI0025D72E5B|nr:aminotransferase class IV [Anaeromicrobium sp.]MCT4595736.1 aminotransferase class IV [Anaeromicrobium sp.]
MKLEAILDYYIYNGEKISIQKEDKFKNIKEPVVYEVIRIIDGQPLFLEEHMERMRKSMDLLKAQLKKDNEEIEREIYELIKINREKNMNVKLVCGDIHNSQNFIVYFIRSNYPNSEVYEKGIHTITYNRERHNPNAKVVNWDLRSKINEKLKEEKAFEALLVNEEGYVTEGSRSNIFFVDEDCVYTASNENVLMGITRAQIFKICESLNLKMEEKNISVREIGNLKGAFMTGTSVNVLPIRTVENINLNSVKSEIIKDISHSYNKMVEEHIKNRKKEQLD